MLNLFKAWAMKGLELIITRLVWLEAPDEVREVKASNYSAPICTCQEFVPNNNYIKRISLLSQAPEAVFVCKRIQTTEDLQITNIFLNVPIDSTNSLLCET